MKRISILWLAAFALLLASCRNTATKLPVPKDAAFVVHIDAASLTSKLKWEELKTSEWFQDIYNEERDSLTKKLMDNPEASGIDMKSDFVFFSKKEGKFAYMVFQGNLKDSKAFEEIIKQKKTEKKPARDGELTYIAADDNTMIGWNSSQFIVSSATRSEINYDDENWQVTLQAGADTLRKFTKNVLAITSGNSLSSDDRYSALLKEKGDMHFWVGSYEYSSDLGKYVQDEKLSSVLYSLQDLMKGNVSTATLSFDDGKISVQSKQFYGEKMKEIMAKHDMKPVSTDLVNRIPSANPLMVIASNYPPELALEIVRATGLAPIANGFLKKYNLTVEEMMNATKGEFLLGLTDFSIVTSNVRINPETDYTYPKPQPKVEAFMALSTANKSTFDKLIGIAESAMDSTEKNELLSRISYRSTNEWFVLGTTPELTQRFLAGTGSKLPFADRISGHPFGVYIDLKQFINRSQAMTGQDSASARITGEMWQDITIIGGNYKDGVATGEVTINLADKSTNSLKQINRHFTALYQTRKNRMAVPEIENIVPADTTVAPQAPDAN